MSFSNNEISGNEQHRMTADDAKGELTSLQNT
jgi:hypothetical protein